MEDLSSGAAYQTQRMSRLTLEQGEIVSAPSPCGLDCSYSIQFEGPYAQCSEYSMDQDIDTISNSCPIAAFASSMVGNNLEMNVTRLASGSGQRRWQVQGIKCTPSSAVYAVDFTYRAGVRTISHSAKYTGSLDGRMRGVVTDGRSSLLVPAVVDGVVASNHYAVITALLEPLQGSHNMSRHGTFTYRPGGGLSETAWPCCESRLLAPTKSFDDQIANTPLVGSPGNIAVDTRFNTQRDNYTRQQADGPVFDTTKELLNEALFNLTISLALQLDYWNTTVTISTTEFINVYSFSNPKQLIVPYLACLLTSFPFLVLGLLSIRLNGVAAIQGGFLQVLMTTIGSETLKKAATGSSLGGDENVPNKLEKLRIRFGELIGGDNRDDVRRAGFGTEDEIIPLRCGVPYTS
jgi:hypothetical protein